MGGRPGTRHPGIDMFTQKTADFYRSFLDRLYCVADLLTERPELKPPDCEPDPKPPWIGPAVVPPTVPNLGRVVDKPTWTKKWTFEHFVKKRRRKLTRTLILFHMKIIDLSSSFMLGSQFIRLFI